MDFKDRLRYLREEQGISTAELAARFHKSESAVRMWETGRSKPDADTLVKLAVHFGTSTDYLLGLDDYKNKEELHSVDEEMRALGKNILPENRFVFLRYINTILSVPLRLPDIIESEEVYHDYFLQLLILLAHSSISLTRFFDEKEPAQNSYIKLSSILQKEKRFVEAILDLYYAQLLRYGSNYAMSNCHDCNADFVKYVELNFYKIIDIEKMNAKIVSVLNDLDVTRSTDHSTANVEGEVK